MLILFIFLSWMICSVSLVGMEEQRVSFPIQILKPSATSEIFNRARDAACSGYFKRLESFLENYTFNEEQKINLLPHTIGCKGLGREFIDCFALLLLHGTRLDKATSTTDFRAPLQVIEEGQYSKKYTKVALVFRAGLGDQDLDRLAGMVHDTSLDANTLDSYFKPRVKILREALKPCDTLRDAARHEDIDLLKKLLAKLGEKQASERDTQLWQALEAAILLDKTELIDELVSYGAPIKTRLDYSFFTHLDVLRHCVAKGYITIEDLDRYTTQIPKRYGIGYSSMTEAQFNAQKVNAGTVLMEAKKSVGAKRLLNLTESEVQALPKQAKTIEKKDE